MRDEVCADYGSGDDDEESLDKENCAEPETVARDAFGCDERSGSEGEECADEEGGQRDECSCPSVRVVW